MPDPSADREALIEQSIVGVDHGEPGEPEIDRERPARRQPRSLLQPAVKNRLAQPVIHLSGDDPGSALDHENRARWRLDCEHPARDERPSLLGAASPISSVAGTRPKHTSIGAPLPREARTADVDRWRVPLAGTWKRRTMA